MKHHYFVRAAYFVAILLTILTAGCQRKPKQAPEKAFIPPPMPPQNDLPAMPVSLLSGESINLKTLTGKTVLVLFFPDCDHCQREAQAIEKNLAAFDSYQIYFVSSATPEELTAFAQAYQLADKANVHFGTTTSEYVLANFGAISTPSIYIYSAEGKKVTSFNGETAIEVILKYL